MPKYYIPKKDFYIIPFEDVKMMINAAKDIRMKAILALVWITGARIGEILKLRKEDFIIDPEKNLVLLTIQTLKGGVPRELKLDINTPTMKEIVLRYIQTRHANQLFDIGERRAQQWLTEINQELWKDDKTKWLTFHQFRHSRSSFLGHRLRASMSELMDWFGWKSTSQVGTYQIRESSERFKDKIR